MERAVPMTIMQRLLQTLSHVFAFLLCDFFHLSFSQFADFIAVRHFRSRFDPNSFKIILETGGCL